MKIAVISLSPAGVRAVELLAASPGDWTHLPLQRKGVLRELIRDVFTLFDGLVCVMACGIVVRVIADLLQDKYHDPVVVVVDDAWRHAVSLLAGHEGEANALAYRVAAVLGSEVVVTTASGTNKDLILGIGCRKDLPPEEICGRWLITPRGYALPSTEAF